MVWGSSVKHNPQKVGREHVLKDEDVVQIIKKCAHFSLAKVVSTGLFALYLIPFTKFIRPFRLDVSFGTARQNLISLVARLFFVHEFRDPQFESNICIF